MEINKYDYASENLEELACEYTNKSAKCLKLRVIGSETLVSTKGLDVFTSIEELNLSGNKITVLEDHLQLINLKVLNLSCNLLRTIPDFSGLQNLRKINLTGNKIASLSGLKTVNQGNLQSLIIPDNSLNNLKEIKLLQMFSNLKEVVFHKNAEQSNPFCKDLRLYYSEVIQLDNIERFLLDGKDATQIADFLYNEISVKKNNPIAEDKSKNINPVDKDPQHTFNRSARRFEGLSKSNREFPVDDPVNRNIVNSATRDEPRHSNRNNYAIDDDKYESVRVFEITKSNSELKEKLGNAINIGREKEKLMFERENVLKNTVEHLQKRLDEYESIINKLSNQLKNRDNENIRLNQQVTTFEASILDRDKIIKSLTERLESEIQSKLGFKYKAENLNDNTLDREIELRSLRDKYQNAQIDCKKLENELSLLKEKYTYMEYERRSRDQEKKEKEGSLYDQSKFLEEENLKLKMYNFELKNEANILKEREKVNIEKAELEMQKKFHSKVEEMEKDYKNTINDLIQEKRDLEASFKQNLDNMEEELRDIIMNLSEKNNAISKDNNTLKNEKVK